MIRLVCWNIDKRTKPWHVLVEMARRGEVDVALLQEAGNPPAELAHLVRYDEEHVNPQLYDRWPLVVQLSDRTEIEWFRQAPPRSEFGEREIGVGGIGTLAAARVAPRGKREEAFVAVSMYARWMKFHPLTGHQKSVGASDVSAHRILSDLSTFICDDRSWAEHRILAAGDLNMFYGAAHRRLSMPERERTVWDRFAALGLEFMGTAGSERATVLIAAAGCAGGHRERPNVLHHSPEACGGGQPPTGLCLRVAWLPRRGDGTGSQRHR